MPICSNCGKPIQGTPHRGRPIVPREPYDPRAYEDYSKDSLAKIPLLCSKCAIEQMEEAIEEQTRLDTETQECGVCHRVLPLRDFYPKTSKNPKKRRKICKSCDYASKLKREQRQTAREGTRTVRRRAKIHKRELGEMFGGIIPKDWLDRYPKIEGQIVESNYRTKEEIGELVFEEAKNDWANVHANVSKAMKKIKEEIEKEFKGLSKDIGEILDSPEIEEDIRDYVLKKIKEERARRRVLGR